MGSVRDLQNRGGVPARAVEGDDDPPARSHALDTFHGPSFDVRSRRELAESMADFLDLPPGEHALHRRT